MATDMSWERVVLMPLPTEDRNSNAAQGNSLHKTNKPCKFDPFKQLARLLGLLVFALILTRLDFANLGSALFGADIVWLLVSVPFFIPNFLVKSVLWGIILRVQGYSISLWDRFLFNLAGFYAGTITPGRVGDFTRVLYLREQGVPFESALFSVFLMRAFDLFLIGAIGLLAIPLLMPWIGHGIIAPLSLALMLVAGLFLCLATGSAWIERAAGRIHWSWLNTISGHIAKWLRSFTNAASHMAKQTVLVAVFLTLLSITLTFTRCYVLILALHINLSFLHVCAFVAVSQLVELVPISIAGIGTRDAVLICAFGNAGLAPESAIAFSVLILFSYGLNSLFGLGAWLLRPINFRGLYPKTEIGRLFH